MIKLLDIKKIYNNGGLDLTDEMQEIRLVLLADSKEDVLPTQLADVPGITGAGSITAGSICVTPALDMCIMANDGTWGPWV